LGGYLEFIRGYGTHYLAGVTMGGRFGFQSEFETNSYMNMLSIGLDVKVAAGYSGRIDIEANTATDIQIQMAHVFNSHQKTYKIQHTMYFRNEEWPISRTSKIAK